MSCAANWIADVRKPAHGSSEECWVQQPPTASGGQIGGQGLSSQIQLGGHAIVRPRRRRGRRCVGRRDAARTSPPPPATERMELGGAGRCE